MSDSATIMFIYNYKYCKLVYPSFHLLPGDSFASIAMHIYYFCKHCWQAKAWWRLYA